MARGERAEHGVVVVDEGLGGKFNFLAGPVD
jgi:hypothetical protein